MRTAATVGALSFTQTRSSQHFWRSSDRSLMGRSADLMSTRFFYVDESYDENRFCLSAMGILHRDWRNCFTLAAEHRRLLKRDHGVFIRKEIHARDLVSGRGKIASQVIGKHARSRIFHGLLGLVATFPEVLLFNICLERRGRRDPQLDAWDRLINRIERTMLYLD